MTRTTAVCIICDREIPLLPLGQSRKICRTGDCKRLYVQLKNREWRAAHPDGVRAQNRRGYVRRVVREGRVITRTPGLRVSITCKACQVVFEVQPSRADRLYCSAACYHKSVPMPTKRATKRAGWRPGVYRDRQCDVCKSTYTPVQSRQRACSPPCSREIAYAANKAWWAEHGAERAKLYRSREWQEIKAQRLASKTKAPSMSHCLWCGDDLDGDPSETYCSDECRWEDAAERQREAS